MKRWWRSVAGLSLVLAVFALGACAREPIQKALAGSLTPTEENQVVATHCQGCHVHSRFKAVEHIEKVRLRYAADSPLRGSTQCLKCHQLKLENIFRNEVRHTEFPKGALVKMTDVPVPSGEAKAPAKKDVPKTEAEKKRKWYFFYLF